MNALVTAIKAFFLVLKNPKLADNLTQTKTPIEESAKNYPHLKMLHLLQQSGRLIDFFKEDISGFSDEDVGACMRKIHADCAKLLEDIVTIRPVLEESEGQEVTLSANYDPAKIKLVGNVKEPPFKGIVVHKGWKAHKLSLPKSELHTSEIIQSAEIEVK